MTITVSTDGSALGNPNGPMGWAWADHEVDAGGRPGHEHPGDCDAGGATNGTNQIGELCAVLEALRAHPGEEPLVIETDSQYAINCSTKWVHGWKRNGWKNSQKKPVKNAQLVKAIDAEISRRAGSVKFVWVKGHAGNAGNEKVDELARTYAGDCRSKARDGYLPKEGWQSLLGSDYSKGTDVPADAQMLLDGSITAEEYHLGRGESSGDGPNGSTTNHAAQSASKSASKPSAKPSLAELLKEPEGVPDYDAKPAPEKQPAPASARRPAPRSQPASTPPTPAAHRPSGLRAQGTVRITPPPSSSPSFQGGSITITGTITFTGTVAADGTMELDGDVFLGR
ncbi:ribonuclease HI [Bifidobacterium sp. SMB2]|uniref:ribonuclease H n=1 Tax=Bifidobacterium saimiriisciurei TaxID=2661627 RepID=A0ABX0CAM3_9BIFI|nr:MULTISPECIES: ribonuclease H [Bifidobacterium]NEG95209.1 ribonuclease HI [Bifidobacterium sp. SMB2]NEH11286.1 ribonuclease HI [Bifidobacterium saimiriisciurei]